MPARKPTGDTDPPAAPPACKFTIDELVRAAETTVRNVRSYQGRDLIDPPERRGHVGIYTRVHLGRFKLTNHLLGRGYTLSNIQELLKVIVEGHDLRSIPGPESAIVSPWSDESSKHYSLLTPARLFDRAMSCRALARAVPFSLLEPGNLGYLARSPKALLAGAQMAEAGFPLVEVFNIVERARPRAQAVADNLVSMVMRELDKCGSDLSSVEDVPRLVDMIWHIRPLMLVVVRAELIRAFETAASRYLDDCVVQIIEHMHEPLDSASGPDKGQCFQRAHAWNTPDLSLV